MQALIDKALEYQGIEEEFQKCVISRTF